MKVKVEKIPFLFFPDSERNLITVDIKLPQGTRIETTSLVVEGIETYLIDHLRLDENRTRGVIDWSAFIGKGPESYDLGYSPDEAIGKALEWDMWIAGDTLKKGEIIGVTEDFHFSSIDNQYVPHRSHCQQ